MSNLAAGGPLVVSAANPRYFTIDGQRAVYLTGSHIWNNFHDGLGPGAACAEPPEQNDYVAYLDFLKAHGHNFIRLWRWEHFQSQAGRRLLHLCMSRSRGRAPGPARRQGRQAEVRPGHSSIRRTSTGSASA